ncbi:unnamed protein product [Trifolium pratense]|uniref:Uncharacterized protein n=1 Tax=Trifolium pratense TaxID=57577 RepID=A0ACB0MCZ0_TRIPR|nr:unnamed protein product [Trifolium pratense]
MAILKLLSEEVFDFSRGEMTQQKINELKHSLNSSLQPRAVNWGLVTKGVTGMVEIKMLTDYASEEPNLCEWMQEDKELSTHGHYLYYEIGEIDKELYLVRGYHSKEAGSC